MGLNTWQETLIVATGDGTTLTAASAASAIPSGAKWKCPANFWAVGKQVRITAAGRISCIVTTPGTARFDFRMGSTVVLDSGALNLNTVAKTTVPWLLEMEMTCRAIGSSTSANLMGVGYFQSEAVIASPLPSVGGNGALIFPVGTPAVGNGFDSTIDNLTDFFFTQTVATGSFTLHQYRIEALN